MKKFNWNEFKPATIFLAKFVGLYISLNLLYGIFVSAYRPAADPITRWVTENTRAVLSIFNHDAEIIHQANRATSTIRFSGHAIVSVYEGCNGVNVVVIFLAFLFAFGPYRRQLLWFIPVGIAFIHLFNLIRIGGLFFITLYKPDWTYFLHKYLFTAFIYLIVFALWFWWVSRFSKLRYEKA